MDILSLRVELDEFPGGVREHLNWLINLLGNNTAYISNTFFVFKFALEHFSKHIWKNTFREGLTFH